jgi:hypothetical protein
MANTYTLISSNTVGSGGAADVTFSSIPATYTDLKLVMSARCNNSAVGDDIVYQFNGDTTSGRYSYKFLLGNGAAASSSGNSSTTFNYFGLVDAATATTSTFSNSELYIPNYAGSNQKSSSVDGVSESNATTAYATLVASLYNQTTAISSIKIYSAVSNSFVQYSTFYLYGIKNS